MDITPLPNIIYLEFPPVEAGVLDTSSRSTASEVATVLAVGEGVTIVKPGDKVFVKSWAVDTITYQDKQYRFVNDYVDGILAVIK